MGPIAYLVPAFPVDHQTFILWDVLGLTSNDVRPARHSTRARLTVACRASNRDDANDRRLGV